MKFAESGENPEPSAKTVSATERGQTIDPELIQWQLTKIVNSQEFARSARMARFLRQIVQCRLEGRSEFGKKRSIGVEVFDRATDWNPKSTQLSRRIQSGISETIEWHPLCKVLR